MGAEIKEPGDVGRGLQPVIGKQQAHIKGGEGANGANWCGMVTC
jgi:hypothetical protein